MQNTTYYKIIGNNFGKFNYKFGLNTLTETFNPSKECGPGGLYFCDIQHIFEFLEYGDKVCTIELPEDEDAQVVQVENKYKADKIIIKTIKNLYDENMFKYLLEKGANVHAGDDYALRWASERGHTNVVKLLLEHGADVHADNNGALRCASAMGHIDVVRLLLEYGANVHADDDYSLRWAYGCSKIVVRTRCRCACRG